MSGWFAQLVLAFVPLFIVIDSLGNLPFVVTLTEGMPSVERRRAIHVATLTAAVVGLVFLFFGKLILSVLGISVGSFAVAGGIILLVLAVRYMTTGKMSDMSHEDMVGVVPIGTPLTVGPATITTLLLLASQFPIYTVLAAFVLNLIVVWIIYQLSGGIIRVTGKGGLAVVSRVFDLLLAAIAVSMIIRGLDLLGIISTAGG
ncbi:MAG: MarC family protein [Dehalococcoidales bacterium]|nr:MarC family protein [Dehalococcoidales bacterium]